MNRILYISCYSAAGAFILSFVSTILVKGIAERFGILSDPKKVRFYTGSSPLLGHIPLFLGFFIPFAVMFGLRIFADDYFYSLSELKKITSGLLFSSLFLLISATCSDIRNDSGEFEWIYIIASSLLLYFFDIRFVVLKMPLIGDIDVQFWGLPLLVVWTLLVVSIVELLDFFEGIAGSVIAAISLVYFYLHLASGKQELYVTVLFATLGGAVMGMSPFLLRKKIIFGKSGNKIVGFLFAAGTIIARRKETTGQFILFPIALILFFIVLVNFLFLESQLRPLSGSDNKQ
ncbi:hypothetical protein JW926_03980 [Candidatus Sumerlaeota bacterium]|nr:hypothetical protein [Candidatus Sumerlaeota bacterium]